MRGLRQGSSWRWFWLARRKGKGNWCEASNAGEAIRKAMLLPPRKPPAWLREAASDAERQVIAATGAEAREDPDPTT